MAATLTPTASYLGYDFAALGGTGLEVVRLNSINLAIGSRSLLEDALDVLDGGKPGIDTGPFGAELLALDGIYKRLWDYQSGGFLAPD